MDVAQFITSIITLLVILHVFLIGTAYLILVERTIAAWAQDRIGPNRVGLTFGLLPNSWHMQGLGQPLADGLKFILKEDYNPGNVDKGLFIAAPVMAVMPALIAWAVIPWGGVWDSGWGALQVVVADINIGVIFILAISSLSVYGVAVGAWAANNKYTFVGGIRATAQMLSYEIPMGLCVLCVLLLSATPAADGLVNSQVGYWWGVIPSWYIFQQPLAAVLFYICVLAETNRAPFDLAEAEQELIGGFHTEYSSMKFALFFLGEYMHMLTGAAFFVVLFLGGWHLPWLDYALYDGAQPVYAGILGVLLKVVVFLAKVLAMVVLMMWIRWTLPRFRFDQLMRAAWQGLIPVSLALLLTSGVFVFFGLGRLHVGGQPPRPRRRTGRQPLHPPRRAGQPQGPPRRLPLQSSAAVGSAIRGPSPAANACPAPSRAPYFHAVLQSVRAGKSFSSRVSAFPPSPATAAEARSRLSSIRIGLNDPPRT